MNSIKSNEESAFFLILFSEILLPLQLLLSNSQPSLQPPAQQWSLHNVDAEMRNQHFVMGSQTKIKHRFPGLQSDGWHSAGPGKSFWTRGILVWALMLPRLCLVGFAHLGSLCCTKKVLSVELDVSPGQESRGRVPAELAQVTQPRLFLGTGCSPARGSGSSGCTGLHSL